MPVGANTPVDINVRLICATNRPLNNMVHEGHFREDLLYRINTVELQLPPLRERPEDLPVLLKHFCKQYAQKYDRALPELDPQCLRRLQAYHWPGNIRELRHAVERAIILADDGHLDTDLLLMQRRDTNHKVQNDDTADSFNLAHQERQIIEQALRAYHGNVSKAASALGITRPSLYRRMTKYGL